MNTGQVTLDPAHVARIESTYSAHLRALHAAFGITPVVVDYDYDRDYIGLPDMPHDLQLRAPLEGGLVVEAYENVPGQTTQSNRPWGKESTGLFCPRGDEPGEWCITIARWEAIDQRAYREHPLGGGGGFGTSRIGKVGLSEIARTCSTDRSPHSLAQAVGTALHSAVGARSA